MLRKKNSFQLLLFIDNAPGHSSTDGDVEGDCVVFIPADKTSILKPMDQGVISTFKSYDLRNIFCKVIAMKDTCSSDGSGQTKLKTLWKGFTILNAIKNICDSWKEVKISTLTGVWKT